MSDQAATQPPATASVPSEIDTLRDLVKRQDRVISLQREILDHLTHEVRTPIAAIQNANYLIETYGRESPAQCGKWQGMIKEAAEALRTLMAEFVDTQRLAASARTLSLRPESPGQIVRACIARLPEPARVRVEISPAAEPLRQIDPAPLELALQALLDNALKFSPPDRVVQVTLEATGAKLQIKVVDQGCGIPAEETASLFSPFRRASNAESFPGSGLGLAVARCAADLLAGTLSFESAEGIGSTFVLTLPAPLAAAG